MIGAEILVTSIHRGALEKGQSISKAMRAAAKEAKSTKVLLEEESEQIDDDWLDDEQWYSEHAAK